MNTKLFAQLIMFLIHTHVVSLTDSVFLNLFLIHAYVVSLIDYVLLYDL
jgi:hypothetical protein